MRGRLVQIERGLSDAQDWENMRPKVNALISTDLFSNPMVGLCCRAADVPYLYRCANETRVN